MNDKDMKAFIRNEVINVIEDLTLDAEEVEPVDVEFSLKDFWLEYRCDIWMALCLASIWCLLLKAVK